MVSPDVVGIESEYFVLYFRMYILVYVRLIMSGYLFFCIYFNVWYLVHHMLSKMRRNSGICATCVPVIVQYIITSLLLLST